MKLAGKLPAGDANGLGPIEQRITAEPDSHVVVLMILDAKSVTMNTDTGESEATLRIRRLEALLPEDVEAGTRLIRRAFESRTGETTLPIEMEEDINSALLKFGKGMYVPETDRDEPEAEPEVVIDVPTDGYFAMTVVLLTALLRKRGLDASKGTKAELVNRLEAHDLDPSASLPKTNVTNLFSDGTARPPVEDTTVPYEDVDEE